MSVFHKLRHVVTFQKCNSENDAYGGQINTYIPHKKTWAMVEKVNISASQIKGSDFSKKYYKFTIRSMRDLEPNMLIRLGNKQYKIKSYDFAQNCQNMYQEIIAFEQVNYVVNS